MFVSHDVNAIWPFCHNHLLVIDSLVIARTLLLFVRSNLLVIAICHRERRSNLSSSLFVIARRAFFPTKQSSCDCGHFDCAQCKDCFGRENIVLAMTSTPQGIASPQSTRARLAMTLGEQPLHQPFLMDFERRQRFTLRGDLFIQRGQQLRDSLLFFWQSWHKKLIVNELTIIY